MFKELRERTGHTPDCVAKKLGVKKTTLYKYEECHSIPSTSILLKMVDIYKCDYKEVLDAYKFSKGVYNEKRNRKRGK